MATQSAPESGAINVDQAVALLDLPKKEVTEASPEQAQEATQEGQDSSATPKAEAADGAETQTDSESGAEQAAEAEGETPEQSPFEPPKFWDAEKKELFRGLPREAQEYILKKEDERNSITSKSLQESVEKRKAADAELQRVTQYISALDNLLPQARTTFGNRWANVDWDATLTQYGAEQTLRFRNQMEAEERQLKAIEGASAEAERLRLHQHTQNETARLPEVAPELADATHGKQRRDELVKFLNDRGFSQQRITWMTAEEASLAYDAMRWRNGQQQAKALVNAPKQPIPPKKVTPAKPTASARPGNATQDRITALSRKRELSIDEAVELSTLKQGQPN